MLSVMYAGPDAACQVVEPILAGLSDRNRRVGDRPGMAQALKLANNFLSATALAATSEAIAFGLSVGLDMQTMLEVIDASNGQSAATRDKFPNHVLTGRVRGRVRQLVDVQGSEAVPERGGGTGRAFGARGHHGVSVGAVRCSGAGGRLHPDLPLCGRMKDGRRPVSRSLRTTDEWR